MNLVVQLGMAMLGGLVGGVIAVGFADWYRSR